MEEDKVEETKKKIVEPDFIMDITDEKEIYTIQAYNNETRPIDKQMRIHIKPLSGKDLAHMASLIKKDIELFQRQNPKDKREFMDLYNMFSEKWEFQYRIEKMENFKFRLNGEEIEFTSPAELYEYENSKIVTIVAELRLKFMQLDMLPVKNS